MSCGPRFRRQICLDNRDAIGLLLDTVDTTDPGRFDGGHDAVAQVDVPKAASADPQVIIVDVYAVSSRELRLTSKYGLLEFRTDDDDFAAVLAEVYPESWTSTVAWDSPVDDGTQRLVNTLFFGRVPG